MFACICCMLIQSEEQTDFNVLHYLFTILLDKLILDFHATRKWIDINGCLKGSKRYSKIGNSNFICKVHRMIINGFKRAKIPDTEIALCFCCTWKTCSCSRVTSWLWPCSLGRWMAFSTRPESAGKKWSFIRKYWNTKTLKKLKGKGPPRTHYLCRWTGRHRCRPLPPLCPPAVYWTCNEHQLWPGGVALPVAAHFPKTVRNYRGFKLYNQ